MKLKPNQPDSCPSINVAGVEYAPGGDGAVTIHDLSHIELAKAAGFVEVGAPAAPVTPSKEK